MKLKIVEDNEQMAQIITNQDKIIKDLRKENEKLKKENDVLLQIHLKKKRGK